MDLTRRIERPRDREDETLTAGERPPRREWLVTNGLGGYASGTVAGMLTRRYHGMLVASLPAPLGRMVLLNHVLERVRLPGRSVIWLGDQDEVAGPARLFGPAVSSGKRAPFLPVRLIPRAAARRVAPTTCVPPPYSQRLRAGERFRQFPL